MATVEEIIRSIRALKAEAENATNPAKRADFVQSARTALGTMITELNTLPEARARAISDFFTTVGEGARSAQQQLDDQTAIYLQGRPDFSPETTFRIPKVTANLKLAMTEIDSKRVGFIISRKTEESQSLLEQEISFDIVATPPPPEALPGLATLPLGPVIATSNADRMAALETLKQADPGNDPHFATARQIIVAKDSNQEFSESYRHTLVLASEDAFVFVYVLPGDRRNSKLLEERGAVVMVPRKAGGALEATSFGGVELYGNEDQKKPVKFMRYPLYALAPLADRQAELLTQLGRQ